jgi:hypothetical protein
MAGVDQDVPSSMTPRALVPREPMQHLLHEDPEKERRSRDQYHLRVIHKKPLSVFLTKLLIISFRKIRTNP